MFVRLQTLRQEQGALNRKGLPQDNSVITLVYFVDQVFHFVGMERSAAHKHFEAHNANSPHINFVRVFNFL